MQKGTEGNLDSFECLKSFMDINKLQNTVTAFQRYFPAQNPAKYDWIRDHFSATPPHDFSTKEKEQLNDVTSDSTLRLRFGFSRKGLFITKQNSSCNTSSFCTSHQHEIRFFAVISVKRKYRSKLKIENDLRVAMSKLHPQLEKICNTI